MPETLSLLMAQINPTVGAIEANTQKIKAIITAHQDNHDVIVFPELALTGYPPEDLLFRNELFHRVEEALTLLKKTTKHCYVIIGHPIQEKGLCYNAASVITNGKIVGAYYKQILPNEGVFDEKRYFTPGDTPYVFSIKNHRIGLCICEDIWHLGPVDQLINAKADIMLCLNASPFEKEKYRQRESWLIQHAKRGLIAVYVNQVGGQDELVFDGQSMIVDASGKVVARAPAFVEHLQTITMNGTEVKSEIAPLLEENALIYQALVCGLKDYVTKNKFQGVLLGLSGGIDSALTLAIAVDALGASSVQAVLMPSRFTADMSVEDAKLQAETMQVPYITLPIEPAFQSLLTTLAPAFEGLSKDLTEENMQARIRGLLLMALSNKYGRMVVTTSNKSETAVGYTTLYGDMAGGLAVLKDVLKTTVYALANYRNTLSLVIPQRVLTRAPSAELASNQTDQDHLPDYPTLDAILGCYMHERLSTDTIIARGFSEKDVLRVITLVKQNEYKRRQSPPGIKISGCAFDRDWRYPITSGF